MPLYKLLQSQPHRNQRHSQMLEPDRKTFSRSVVPIETAAEIKLMEVASIKLPIRWHCAAKKSQTLQDDLGWWLRLTRPIWAKVDSPVQQTFVLESISIGDLCIRWSILPRCDLVVPSPWGEGCLGPRRKKAKDSVELLNSSWIHGHSF